MAGFAAPAGELRNGCPIERRGRRSPVGRNLDQLALLACRIGFVANQRGAGRALRPDHDRGVGGPDPFHDLPAMPEIIVRAVGAPHLETGIRDRAAELAGQFALFARAAYNDVCQSATPAKKRVPNSRIAAGA